MPCLTCMTPRLQVLGVIALLMRLLGLWPALACLAVSLAVVPINLLVLRTQTKLRRQTLVHTDARVKLTGEVLSGRATAWKSAPRNGCFAILRAGLIVPGMLQWSMRLAADRQGAVAPVHPASITTLRRRAAPRRTCCWRLAA